MTQSKPSVHHLPEAVHSFLRGLLLQAHEQQGPLSKVDQERLAGELLLPVLRQVRAHMVKRKELALEEGLYRVTELVPRPKSDSPEETHVLRVGDLTVEWELYGYTTWIWGEYQVQGGRHPGQFLESLQEQMKRVEKWARGRSFTREEFSAQVNKD